MARVSEHTLKIREVVERVPANKITQVSLGDLQDELQRAGVQLQTPAQRHTVYAELTRRRRKLRRLTPARRKGVKVRTQVEVSEEPLDDFGAGDDIETLRQIVVDLDGQLRRERLKVNVFQLVRAVLSVKWHDLDLLDQLRQIYGPKGLLLSVHALESSVDVGSRDDPQKPSGTAQ
jgi:hypothetical protein